MRLKCLNQRSTGTFQTGLPDGFISNHGNPKKMISTRWKIRYPLGSGVLVDFQTWFPCQERSRLFLVPILHCVTWRYSVIVPNCVTQCYQTPCELYCACQRKRTVFVRTSICLSICFIVFSTAGDISRVSIGSVSTDSTSCDFVSITKNKLCYCLENLC